MENTAFAVLLLEAPESEESTEVARLRTELDEARTEIASLRARISEADQEVSRLRDGKRAAEVERDEARRTQKAASLKATQADQFRLHAERELERAIRQNERAEDANRALTSRLKESNAKLSEGVNSPYSLQSPSICSLPPEPEPDATGDIPDQPGKPPSAIDPYPKRFTKKRTPKGFEEAKKLFSETRTMIRTGKWAEQQRARCPAEAKGNVGIDGRSLVKDGQGRVRAFAEAGGTEDSHAITRYFYDEHGALRLIFQDYGNYVGAESEHLVALDESGRIVGCDNLVLKKGGMEIDPCTERGHLAVEPQADFDKCRE